MGRALLVSTWLPTRSSKLTVFPHLVHLPNHALWVILKRVVDGWDELERVEQTTSFGCRLLHVIGELIGEGSGDGSTLPLFEW